MLCLVALAANACKVAVAKAHFKHAGTLLSMLGMVSADATKEAAMMGAKVQGLVLQYRCESSPIGSCTLRVRSQQLYIKQQPLAQYVCVPDQRLPWLRLVSRAQCSA